MKKGTEMAGASSRCPNFIHIQGECTGAMADKANTGDRRGPKECRKTEEF